MMMAIQVQVRIPYCSFDLEFLIISIINIAIDTSYLLFVGQLYGTGNSYRAAVT